MAGDIPQCAEWLTEEVGVAPSLSISALAIYFPHITILDGTRRKDAVRDVVACINLALNLRNKVETKPIIDIVCGTILDPCACTACRRMRIFISLSGEKVRAAV